MSSIFNNLREYNNYQRVIREGNIPIKTPPTKEEVKRKQREDRWDKIKEGCKSVIILATIILLFASPFLFDEEDILPIAIGYFACFILIPSLVILVGVVVTFVKAQTKNKWKIVVGVIVLLGLVLGAVAIYSNVVGKWRSDRQYEYIDSQRPDKM